MKRPVEIAFTCCKEAKNIDWTMKVFDGLLEEAKVKRYHVRFVNIDNDDLQVFFSDFGKGAKYLCASSLSANQLFFLSKLCARHGVELITSYINGVKIPNVSNAFFNPLDAVERLISHMTACNRRKFAIIGASGMNLESIELCTVYAKVLKRHGIYLDSKSVYFGKNGIIDCIDRFINNANNYDAALCLSDAYGIHLLERLHKQGYKVPDDIMVSGFGNLLLSRMVSPSLTSISKDGYELGAFMVKIAHMKELDEKLGSISLSLTNRLFLRESTNQVCNNKPFCAENLSGINVLGIENKNDLNNDEYMTNILLIESLLYWMDDVSRNILSMLLKGKTYLQISLELNISVSAVQYRVEKIKSRLGLESKESIPLYVNRYSFLFKSICK